LTGSSCAKGNSSETKAEKSAGALLGGGRSGEEVSSGCVKKRITPKKGSRRKSKKKKRGKESNEGPVKAPPQKPNKKQTKAPPTQRGRLKIMQRTHAPQHKHPPTPSTAGTGARFARMEKGVIRYKRKKKQLRICILL